ncbi:hypothetical protein DFJ74DRAFT_702441 [Hyaloraphidium curvatum]|nr:hypothetical protein DFJ74DRAFT_702441 [Hyaloraphidium curvatum]
MVEGIAVQAGLDTRGWLLPAASAAVATSLDLVMDVAMLERGFWEWRDDGPYAADIVGPNGRRGIPLVNYAGWIVLTSVVTGLFVKLGGQKALVDRSKAKSSARVGGAMLLPTFLGMAAHEIRKGRYRYVAYSLLFPTCSWLP